MRVLPYGKGLCLIKDVSIEEGANFSLLNGLPGFKKWVDREIAFRPTGANIIYINHIWPAAQWLEGAEQHIEEFIKHQQQAEQTQRRKADGVDDDDSYRYKREPMAHQRKAFMLSRDVPYFGLFMEQGTGKTKVIYDNAAYLYARGEIDALCIVAWPNGVHRNWIDTELPQDLPDWCPYKAVFWSANRSKWKQREIDDVVNSTGALKIFAFNAEAFSSDRAREAILKFVGGNQTLMVIDQSACIANPQAGRTKFLAKKVGPLAKYRRILDGAPIAQNAGEIYSQFLFLDQKIIGHDTWTAFRNEYCEIGHFNETKGFRNIDKLRALIDNYSFRALERDCLDLPERIYKRWTFDLTEQERALYDELRKKDYTEFEGSLLTTSLPMVKNLRLQQIASGWFPSDTPRLIEAESSRMAAFRQLMPVLTSKTIIYSRFKQDIFQLEKLLGAAAVSYHGDISEDDRAEAKERFQNDPDVKWMIGQPTSLGIGHTLTAAEFIVYYTNHPSLRIREESEKRAHRKGQDKRLKIYDLIATNTTDNKAMRSLRAKKDVATMIMDDPVSYFLMETPDGDEGAESVLCPDQAGASAEVS